MIEVTVKIVVSTKGIVELGLNFKPKYRSGQEEIALWIRITITTTFIALSSKIILVKGLLFNVVIMVVTKIKSKQDKTKKKTK